MPKNVKYDYKLVLICDMMYKIARVLCTCLMHVSDARV